ncbi:MAG: hypothetical protein H6R26_1069 [Proteobacteria bacterium]|nr:hypothetical protein [Pseudomonadota bacterium]
MKREVWAEFEDGSVAKYDVDADGLSDLLVRIRNHGVSCTIWIDGQIFRPGDLADSNDSDAGTH